MSAHELWCTLTAMRPATLLPHRRLGVVRMRSAVGGDAAAAARQGDRAGGAQRGGQVHLAFSRLKGLLSAWPPLAIRLGCDGIAEMNG